MTGDRRDQVRLDRRLHRRLLPAQQHHTRAEVTTIVNRMLGRTADTDFVDTHADELHKFSDVPASCWAYDQIMEATNAHAYRGSSDGEKWTSLLK